MVELFRDAKAIFKDNPVEAFTKGTGGSEFGFHSQRTLEEAVQKLGEELHSQYFISYSPNNRDETIRRAEEERRSDFVSVPLRPSSFIDFPPEGY